MSDQPTQEFVLQRQGPPIIRPSFLFSLIVGIVVVILIALFALDSYFVVEPTEMAGVRRLGQIVTATPLGPGPHFKITAYRRRSTGCRCPWTLSSSTALR